MIRRLRMELTGNPYEFNPNRGAFHPSPCVSLHVHVSILLSTCLFSYAHGSFSYACGFSVYAIGVFFYANLFFSYAVPLFFLCSMAQVGRGEGHGAHRTRSDLFSAILSAEPTCFKAAFVLFLCSMGRFPSISMCLPPSPCLHPVVDTFVFLCPRVFLLCVRFLLLYHRCLVLCQSVLFLCCPPLFLMLHGAGGTGGRGTGAHRTRSDLFWCYPLCGTDFF